MSYCRFPRNEAITRSVVCLSICFSVYFVGAVSYRLIDLGAFTSGESCRHLFGCLVRTSLACNLICTHTRNTHTHTYIHTYIWPTVVAGNCNCCSQQEVQPTSAKDTNCCPQDISAMYFHSLSLFPLLFIKMSQTVGACFFFFFFFHCCCCCWPAVAI